MTEYLEEIAVCPQAKLASKKESRFAVWWRQRDRLQHHLSLLTSILGVDFEVHEATLELSPSERECVLLPALLLQMRSALSSESLRPYDTTSATPPPREFYTRYGR